MVNIAHKTLTGTQLHEPKGADSAASGKVYVSDGAGSGSWSLPVGTWHFINTFTVTTSTPLEVTGIDSTYDEYELVIRITGNSSSDNTLRMQVGTGAGPSWQTGTVYDSSHLLTSSGSGPEVTALDGIYSDISNAQTDMVLNQVADGGLAGSPNLTGTLKFHSPDSTATNHTFTSDVYYLNTNSDPSRSLGVHSYNATTAITAVRFFTSDTANITGTARLYGRNV